ncbi:MAG: hypothetical protein EZS28_043759, partial [Streblomastix strix]
NIILLQRVYKSIEDKTFLIASTSITNFSVPETSKYLRCDVAIGGICLTEARIPRPPPAEEQTEKKDDEPPKATTPQPKYGQAPAVEQHIPTEEEIAAAEEKKWVKGVKYTYIVIVDPCSWVPETVLRKWSLEQPQIIAKAAAEFKKKNK